MSSIGYHWYNNGVVEINIKGDAPDGFVKGRLPVSDSSREKMSENSWMKKATKDKLIERNKKISDHHKNMSDSEKKALSAKISNGRKGKGLGKEPWNKGKKGLQVAWNKGMKMSEDYCEFIRQRISIMSDEDKLKHSQNMSIALKGREPWNKGMSIGPMNKDVVKLAKEKEYLTKLMNGTFNTSKPEDLMYEHLCDIYSDVERSYKNDLYPYVCDFYIKHLELYIELNLNWTHYKKPYNNDDDCNLVLNEWKIKSNESDYYKNAIYTWTDLDVRKLKCACDNNLLYMQIYKDTIYLNGEMICNSNELDNLLKAIEEENE